MNKNRILISTSSFAQYDKELLENLKNHGMEFVLNPYKRVLLEKELVELCRECVGLIAGTEKITADVLRKLDELKVISRCGAGLDNIDLEAAKQLGIKVYNTPDAPTRAVAELTLGLMLNVLRGISKSDREMRKSNWNKPMGTLLAGKKVGIIGLGRIGKEVARLVRAFGAEVLAYDIAIASSNIAIMADLNKLLADSDVVTLHIPSGKEAFIDERKLAIMKAGACFINASRGGLVNEEALYGALKSGKLAGAGIDTFEKEPYQGKLIELENVVLTAHIGSYAKEARALMEKQAVDNLLLGLEVKK